MMAACTLFSDSQSQLVARVLNNSLQPMLLRANSFLSTAEPVQCISDSGSAVLSDVLLADGGDSVDCVSHDESWTSTSILMIQESMDESAMPVSSSLRSPPTQTEETGICASTVSSTTSADRMDPDSSPCLPENAHDHIDSLLHSLLSDLTDEQRDRAETFFRSCASVFFEVGVRHWPY